MGLVLHISQGNVRCVSKKHLRHFWL